MKTLKKQTQGFALVLTLVVLTVLFAAGAGLAINRQMWSFMAQKQLDNSLIDASTKADMSMWFGPVLRDKFQQDGVLNLATSPVYLDSAFISTFEFSTSTNPTTAAVYTTHLRTNETALFQPVVNPITGTMAYPEYDASVGSVAMPVLFNVGALANTNAPTYVDESVVGEPFWGTASYKGYFGVVFNREMSESERTMREGRMTAKDTKLRAWNSIDAGRKGTVHLRVLPVSTFTLFSPYGAASLSNAGSTLALTISTNWIRPITNSISNPNATALSWAGSTNVWNVYNVGMGRIYVEGKIASNSYVAVGMPIVATEGFEGGGVYSLTFPSYIPGASPAGPITLSSSNFWKTKLTTTYTMLVNSDVAPSRLLRAGMTLKDGRWKMEDSLGDVTQSALAKALETNSQVRIVWSASQVAAAYQDWLTNSASPTNAWDTMVTSMINDPALFSTTVITNVADARYLLSPTNWQAGFSIGAGRTGITFKPEIGFYDKFPADRVPRSFFVRVTGTNSPVVRLDVPSVASLTTSSDPAAKKFTFVCPANDLVLEGNFNSPPDDGGTMIVAPKVYVNNAANPAASVGVGGVVVTEAYDPSAPFYAITGGASPSYNLPVSLQGSLVLWSRLDTPTGEPTLAVELRPDPDYILGTKIPNNVPAVVDVRMTSEGLKTYDMWAVQKDALGNVITNTTTPTPTPTTP